MSFFGKMFGGKKEVAPTTGEAIQKLRETENMLIKKQEFLEAKIEDELNIARKNASKNKRELALQALKKKKRLEKQLQQIDGTLSTIEMQREALESANTNTAVLTTMKNAADALKTAHQNMDVDKVHDMMDDIAEQQDVAREISDAISNPVAFGADLDDEDLERELDELEQENFDKEIIGIPEPAPTLPEAPTEDLPEKAKEKKKAATTAAAAADDDDPDMKQLLSWSN
ncbi:charged multivesicular body protein 4c isoform X1 [Drosophila subpulchrella]|uniref:charged multivesicular body protein 4c isoform X1 n=1 Tax=Drosophila subpulchrella TaxID=1486046 RepID=UPI001872865C|nr:charged multivesicular body protein 4c isoform X1 [Drosophila suzukii]XP_037717850.1 charged multivesicular body protein 4c isoform X1 [Drosophila subpulchrella]